MFFYKANDLDLQLLYQVTHFCLMYLKKNAPFSVPPDLLSTGNPHHERTMSQHCNTPGMQWLNAYTIWWWRHRKPEPGCLPSGDSPKQGACSESFLTHPHLPCLWVPPATEIGGLTLLGMQGQHCSEQHSSRQPHAGCSGCARSQRDRGISLREDSRRLSSYENGWTATMSSHTVSETMLSRSQHQRMQDIQVHS